MYLIRIKFGQIIITYTGTYINQFVVDTGSAILQGRLLRNLLLLDDRGLITRGYGKLFVAVPEFARRNYAFNGAHA